MEQKYREVLVLRYDKQMSCAQIANALQLPQEVIETRVFRATRLLKETLERR
jgi:DNA-directed RNA polymerase specialized sigma24 family protein